MEWLHSPLSKHFRRHVDDQDHLGLSAIGELCVIDELAFPFLVFPTQQFLLAVLQYEHPNHVKQTAYRMAIDARQLGTAVAGPSSMGTVVA